MPADKPANVPVVTDEMIDAYKAGFQAAFDRWLVDGDDNKPLDLSRVGTKAGLEAAFAVAAGDLLNA